MTITRQLDDDESIIPHGLHANTRVNLGLRSQALGPLRAIGALILIDDYRTYASYNLFPDSIRSDPTHRGRETREVLRDLQHREEMDRSRGRSQLFARPGIKSTPPLRCVCQNNYRLRTNSLACMRRSYDGGGGKEKSTIAIRRIFAKGCANNIRDCTISR